MGFYDGVNGWIESSKLAKAGFRQCFAKTPELRNLHLSPAFWRGMVFYEEAVDIYIYIFKYI